MPRKIRCLWTEWKLSIHQKAGNFAGFFTAVLGQQQLDHISITQQLNNSGRLR